MRATCSSDTASTTARATSSSTASGHAALAFGAWIAATYVAGQHHRFLVSTIAFVMALLVAQARIESGDLIEPIEHGVLDWLEIHELQEVVGGELEGRHSDDDIVVFKSNGLAAWDVAIAAAAVERARERGVGREL